MGNLAWVVILFVLASGNGWLAMLNFKQENYGAATFSLLVALFCAFAAGVNFANGVS